MAKLTYFNGNGGFWAVDDFEGYSISAFSGNTRTLTYRFSEFDPSSYPYSIVLTYSGLTTAPAERGSFAGQSVATGGTLTTITYKNQAGATIAELTGLKLDAALADLYIRQSRGFEVFQLAIASGLTVIGSNNSSTPFNDWDGDDISTGGGNDNVVAGGGNDFIKDRGGADTYNGGAGRDTVAYDQSFWETTRGNKGLVADLAKGTATGPDGQKDKLIAIEDLRGTYGNDRMTGSKADNEFMGLAGKDTIDGGAGTDWITYRRDDRDDRGGGLFGVDVDLKDGRTAGTARDGWGTVDTIRNIENVEGSDMNDTIRGNAVANHLEGRDGNDLLDGRGGNDQLYGADGNDTLIGGAGNNYLEGGSGADRFEFASLPAGFDGIGDFEVGVDVIAIAGITAQNLTEIVTNADLDGMTMLLFEGATGNIVLRNVAYNAETNLYHLFGFDG